MLPDLHWLSSDVHTTYAPHMQNMCPRFECCVWIIYCVYCLPRNLGSSRCSCNFLLPAIHTGIQWGTCQHVLAYCLMLHIVKSLEPLSSFKSLQCMESIYSYYFMVSVLSRCAADSTTSLQVHHCLVQPTLDTLGGTFKEQRDKAGHSSASCEEEALCVF